MYVVCTYSTYFYMHNKHYIQFNYKPKKKRKRKEIILRKKRKRKNLFYLTFSFRLGFRYVQNHILTSSVFI